MLKVTIEGLPEGRWFTVGGRFKIQDGVMFCDSLSIVPQMEAAEMLEHLVEVQGHPPPETGD